MQLKNWNWKKIIGFFFAFIFIVNISLIGLSVYITESERGPNETGLYFGCGQENDVERIICLVIDGQKELIKTVFGIPTRFEIQRKNRNEIIELCKTPTGGPDIICLKKYSYEI